MLSRLHPRVPGVKDPLACMALLAAGSAAVATLWAGTPARAETTELYTLETTCTLKGGTPKPCVVQAVDQEDGSVTVYTHTVGQNVIAIRVTDTPIEMSVKLPGSDAWASLTSVGARFSTNTLCFNGRDLCVVNPNYLNSVREENPEATTGRDLVGLKFDSDGRVNVTCWDEGCEGLK